MFCHQCGNPLLPSHKYCPKCGQQVVSEHGSNDSIKVHSLDAETLVETPTIPSDLVRLHAAIKSCMLNISSNATSNSLTELLNSLVTTREAGILLITQFYQFYNVNLIFQITEISTAFLVQKQYLKKFIEFDIIEKDYPYVLKEESLKVFEPIREGLISKTDAKFSFKTLFIVLGLLAIAYYLYAPKGVDNSISDFTKSTTYRIGETISVGNFKYNIKKYLFYKKPDGAIYVKVSLSILNQSNESTIAIASLCHLIDDNGKIYDISVEEGVELSLYGENDLFLTQINPGIKKSGFLVFEIPERKRYFLELSGGILNNKSEKVLLE